jgi:anaerobic magnesium-protoporphyrin IX monomethyl ester cyclase
MLRKKEGAEVEVIDGCRGDYQNLINKVHHFSPDILGVSFTTQAATGAYKFINDLKPKRDFSEKPFIVCGGPHATAMPEEVLERSHCDAVVIGEGELTLHEIVQRYGNDNLKFSEIPGVAYIDDGTVQINPKRPLIKNLDELPLPARDLLDLSVYPGLYYKKGSRETYLTSSRGCPYNCVYCSNPVWKNQKPWYRLRSPENVVDEIEHLVKDLGFTEIYDQTDEFNGNLK